MLAQNPFGKVNPPPGVAEYSTSGELSGLPVFINNILKILRLVKKQSLYLLLHFEHPDELIEKTKKAIKKLRSTGAILLSQSVFLKGINDKVSVLEKLFEKLTALGVRPYYILHND